MPLVVGPSDVGMRVEMRPPTQGGLLDSENEFSPLLQKLDSKTVFGTYGSPRNQPQADVIW